MACSKRIMHLTGLLHIVALFVAIIGTYKQIESVKSGAGPSVALSLSLMIMLLLRIPNQVCVALESSHGWYSVIGTMFGAASFAVLTYYNYQAALVHHKQHPAV